MHTFCANCYMSLLRQEFPVYVSRALAYRPTGPTNWSHTYWPNEVLLWSWAAKATIQAGAVVG